MRFFEVNLDEKEVNLYILGDVHIGNKACAIPQLKSAVRTIANDPIGYWIGIGDYIEAINVDDKRFLGKYLSDDFKVEDLDDLPGAQAKRFIKIVEPIANKCIALVEGNHEEKIEKKYHFDVMKYIYDKIQEKSDRKIALIRTIGILSILIGKLRKLNFRSRINIALNHGCSGTGKREGYPLNLLHDIFRWYVLDLHVMGHLHTFNADRKVYITNNQLMLPYKYEAYYIVNGCFMTSREQADTYFDRRGKYDSDIGVTKIEIRLSKIYEEETKRWRNKINFDINFKRF